MLCTGQKASPAKRSTDSDVECMQKSYLLFLTTMHSSRRCRDLFVELSLQLQIMTRRASYAVLSSSSCHLRWRLHQAACCNLVQEHTYVLPSRSGATPARYDSRIMPSINTSDMVVFPVTPQPRRCISTISATINNNTSRSDNENTTNNTTKGNLKKDDCVRNTLWKKSMSLLLGELCLST